ncbi:MULTISPECIES: autotransporter serine protease [unclassified Pseudomonas]|uniref:autotransporter domain-containing protein n=1 Tax=unclassified Pseudomonas TaxID=196821 RepID=UPI00244B73C0|nr:MULTISPECIES: autotransporter serine protease [unclassified Pseudomonas]MDH0303336.1 autotransporter domain-containing protein [Pseudomonas sp. GD04091]MDH1985360.1 autotransporter domain-containing protein [Pseudomonas sp. GD03689]
MGTAQAAPYVESGRLGDASSWRSSEFKADWGLGAIHADSAYAAGYSGKGVKLGIFDQPVYAQHPEFAGKDKIVTLVTSGIRQYTDPYIPVKAGDAFRYDGSPSVGSDGKLGSHGTHVGGIAAGNRDGVSMHGVAFDAQIISADNGDPGPEDGIVLGNDGAVYKAGWDSLVASGARIINNSWGIGITDRFAKGGRDPAFPHFTVDDARAQFAQIQPLLGTMPGGAYDGALAAARSGVLTIFAAGNDYNLNNPDAIAGLAYFVPQIAPNWLTVAALQQNPDTNSANPYLISTFSSRCGYTASFCVSAPGTRIYSAVIGGTSLEDLTLGYGNKNGTSMAAPHAAGAAAVLMERFPYMSGAQIASVLRTTATDMGAPGIDALYGWGMIDLDKGLRGPGMLVTEQDIPEAFRIAGGYGPSQFVVDLPGIGALVDAGRPTERRCNDLSCVLDLWSNDIAGHGGLTKQGIGTLVLTGDNTYSGPTLVNQGRLAVNGSLQSTVTVNASGVLGGNGRIGALVVNSGGVVAPGNSIGTLQVSSDVTFQPGSTYAVEVDAAGSDRLVSDGKVSLGGANLALDLQNPGVSLQSQQATSLVGRQFDILDAAGGVQGGFASVQSNSLFLGGGLAYTGSGVQLAVQRNATAFASVGLTANQRSVAAAADRLGAGNPVYESLLSSADAGSAQRAFDQLSGEIHPAVGNLLLNDSRQLRDAVGERTRQQGVAAAPTVEGQGNGLWVKALGAWGKAEGDSARARYSSSIGGLLLGIDGQMSEDTRVGVFTGYSDSSLSMGDGRHSSASVDSYHLGAYAGKELEQLRLSLGASHSWHRIETKRELQYNEVSDRQKSKRDAQSTQVFGEAAWKVELPSVALEPFANLAYVHIASDSFKEHGGAAALKGGEDNRDAWLSTLGMRAGKQLQLSGGQAVELSATLGWQHNLSSTGADQHLAFAGQGDTYKVQALSLDRDAAVVGARVGVALSRQARVNLDYNGLLGSRDKSHGVGLTLDWAF